MSEKHDHDTKPTVNESLTVQTKPTPEESSAVPALPPVPGMTLRDWFAGQAMQSEIQTCCVPGEPGEALIRRAIDAGQEPAFRLALNAYEWADHMMTARSAPVQKPATAPSSHDALAMLRKLAGFAQGARNGLDLPMGDGTMCRQTMDWSRGLVELADEALNMLAKGQQWGKGK